MRPKRLAALVGLLFVVGGVIGLGGPTGALAAGDGAFYTGSNPAYDINSYNFYCTGGGTACIPSGSYASDCAAATVACPGLNYADVEAFGPTNGATNGTPDELVLFCAQDTSAGTPGYNFGWVDVVSPQGELDYPIEGGPSHLYGAYQNADPGTIGGKGTLLQANPPDLTGKFYSHAQVSSVNATAFNPDQSLADEINSQEEWTYPVRGSVTGTQNTDNHGDMLNAGQFRITITGYLYHLAPGGATATTYWGTISCTAGGPHAFDIAGAGLEFLGQGSPSYLYYSAAEGELEYYVGDNPFFISPPIPLG